MSEPYIGEIRMFAGNFAPAGWAFCDGQLMPISENDALFALLGTTYGGDGESTFGLPDLRGRIPIHQGSGFIMAEASGVESVTLTVNQIPNHTHPMTASLSNANNSPEGAVLAQPTTLDLYRPSTVPDSPMAAQAIGIAGGSQPHDNMQPYLCVSFIISLFGVFPTQN